MSLIPFDEESYRDNESIMPLTFTLFNSISSSHIPASLEPRPYLYIMDPPTYYNIIVVFFKAKIRQMSSNFHLKKSGT